MFKASILAAALLAGMPTQMAHAQPKGGVTVVDTQGWTLLGQQEVRGKRDKDTIVVGKYEGKFDQIQLVVLDSDIELKDLTITFANGEKWSPALRTSFKEGQRSKAIDLPGKDRTIAKIELVYANTPGGGAAKVAIYGRDKAAKVTPPPATNTPGWTLLGEQKVAGKRDRDTFVVGKYEGVYDQIQVSVLDSDVEIKDLTVTFANGEKWQANIKHSFKEGQRSKAIDLPGRDRMIAKIDVLYANTPGGGAARVQIFGRDKQKGASSGPSMPQPVAAVFDPTGWTKLGEQTVNGGRDKDTIKVGKYKGAFDQIVMVVTDSDLELTNLTVKFPKGEAWSPSLRHTFKEGSRSHVIDLPGKDRIINKIELAYANLPGGGKAKVAVYGKDTGRQYAPPPPPVTWDNKGWQRIANTTVDGWRDRDHVDVKAPQGFSEVMFVVGGSDVELRNVSFTLGNGEKFDMPSSVVFKEGTRTAPVDIPGKVRKIKSIDVTYANLPGGGRASLEIWARTKPGGGQPQPGQGPQQQGPDVRDHRGH
jgi:hypothetical protein